MPQPETVRTMSSTATTPRSILITGCSSGIGLCTARGLKARGHRVFASARKESDVARLRDEGLETVRLDLDDSASIQAAVEEVLGATGGTLDALFNNAAWGLNGALEDMSREALRAQFETNVFGTVELTNRVIPVMRRQGHGRILFNSSVLGLVALPYRGPYCASKFALEAFADTLRLELRGAGIQVSLIEPGPILSHFRANALAAFQRYVNVEGSTHEASYQRQLVRLQKEGAASRFTLGPEAVLTKVIHALESPRPRIRYYVTVPTHVFGYLRRLLPYRAMDGLLSRSG